jgi:plasmid rolling circle replication initiator protein Rep
MSKSVKQTKIDILNHNNFPQNINNWKQKKLDTLNLAKSYRRIGDTKKAERTHQCGEYLTFQECPHGHYKKLNQANFCRLRLCPMCSWRRSLKLVNQLRLITHEANQRRQLKWLFLTLTVRNVDGSLLSDEITHIFQAWQRLSQRRVFRQSVVGWFRALEVTINTQNWTYHPHLHVLLAVQPSYFSGAKYISQDKWVSLWQESLRVDYIPIVDIRTIKPKRNRNRENKILERQEQALHSAVLEAAKYPIKFNNYIIKGDTHSTDKIIKVLDKSLSYRRLIAYGGLLKLIWNELKQGGIIEEIDESHNATPIELNMNEDCQCPTCGSDMLEHMYIWNVGVGSYIRTL